MGMLKPLFVAVLLVSMAPGQKVVREFDALLLPGVEQKLASDADADVAWGGYLAQRYHLQSATRMLVAALRRYQEKNGRKARIVRLHLADALLGIRARVPGEQVAFLLRDPLTRSSAFAILANDPLVNRELLLQLAMSPAPYGDLARRAAGRLLVTKKIRSEKFGEHILSNLSSKLTVTVVGPASDDNRWNSAVGLGGTPPRAIKRSEGFPPLVRLALDDSATNELTVRLFVPDRFGHRPIVLTREEGVSLRPYEFRSASKQPTDVAWEYANLVRAITRVDVKHDRGMEIRWSNRDEFVRAVTDVRDGMRARLDDAVRRMRRKGWLADDALADFRIPLEVEIVDNRGDKSDVLPELPAASGVKGK